MTYDANITVFNSSLSPTMTNYNDVSKTALTNNINTIITNAGSTFHNIQVIIMPHKD